MMLKKSTDHLRDVKEGYFEHMGFALYFSFRLFVASIGVFLHALCPAIFQFVGSGTVKSLSREIEERLARHGDEH